MDWGSFWSILFVMFIMVPLILVWFYAVVDLFLRPDLRGISKVLWLFGIIFFPVVGTLVYLITRPAYPLPRHPQPAEVAGTLTELKSMHAAGVLNDQQYEEQRAHLLTAA